MYSRFASKQRKTMYLHQRNNWWEFRYDKEAVMNKLGPVRAKQGLMLGRMLSLGFDFQDEAMLTTMSLELVRSCEIEGEVLNLTEVRSSIARRLGINTVGLVHASRKSSKPSEWTASSRNITPGAARNPRKAPRSILSSTEPTASSTFAKSSIPPASIPYPRMSS